MSRGFGATFGVNTTDIIKTAFARHSQKRTYSVWTYRNNYGGSGIGRMFDKGGGANQTVLMYAVETGSTYRFEQKWDGVIGSWAVAAPSTNIWHHIAVTYDSGSVSNDPIMYVDGVSGSVTEMDTPSGALGTSAIPFEIGNRSSDSARNWDGMLSDFAIWDEILTPNEIRLLALSVSPWDIRRDYLRHYILPSERGTLHPEGALLFTGTKLREDPRAQYASNDLWLPKRLTILATGGMTITNVVPTVLYEGLTGIIITGTGFGASIGTKTVYLDDKLQTVTAWADTSITISAVSPNLWANARLLQVRNT